MSKRITVTHSDDVTPLDAIAAIHASLAHGATPGSVTTLTNNLKVEYSDATKFPSFYVWKSSIR